MRALIFPTTNNYFILKSKTENALKQQVEFINENKNSPPQKEQQQNPEMALSFKSLNLVLQLTQQKRLKTMLSPTCILISKLKNIEKVFISILESREAVDDKAHLPNVHWRSFCTNPQSNWEVHGAPRRTLYRQPKYHPDM